MADVGVLSLQIEANAESAVSSLNNLAGALSRVQKAISNGLNLSGIASQIAVLGKVVDESISGSTFAKITDLANAVKALQKSSGATKKVENAFVIDDSVAGTIESINSGFASTAGSVQTATEALNGFNASLQETQAIMQDTSWTGGWAQFSNVFNTWSSMRSSMALEAGEGTDLATGIETGWTAWKDGAIEVEGTVTDAFESINARIEGTAQVLLGAGTAAQTFSGEVESAAESAKASFSGWRVFDPKTGDFTKPLDDFNREVISARGNADAATGDVRSMVETTNAIDSSGIRETSDAIAEMKGSAETVGELSPKLEEVSDSGHSAAGAIETVKNALSSMGNAITHSGIWNLGKQFLRVARYRAIRAVIKEITDGIKEGFESYKKYSEGVGNKFSKELKGVNSQLSVMKSSIGAAVAPALSAVIPIINSITSAAITAINWVNQLIALLTGASSWSMAVASTSAAADSMNAVAGSSTAVANSVKRVADRSKDYSKNMSNAKKATEDVKKATKDLLADWDELNIIQSQMSGGGGGGGKKQTDPAIIFKEMHSFEGWIQDVADFIRSHFDEILQLIKDAGIALLAWKLSESLTGPLSVLAGLVAAEKIIKITWKLTEMFDEEYVKSGDKGWLIADALTNIVGATLAGSIVSSVLGGDVGLITAGIELTVSAGITYGISLSKAEGDKAEALRTLSAVKLALGLAAMSLGFGIASGSATLGVLTALTVGVPMFVLTAEFTVVVKQFETAEEIAQKAFADTGEGGISVDEIFKSLQDLFTEAASGYSIVIDSFSGVADLKNDLAGAMESIAMLSATVTGDGKLTKEEAEQFKEAWKTVFSAFEGITEASFKTVLEGLNKSLSSATDEVKKQAKELRVGLLMAQKEITQAMAEFEVEMQELADKVATGKASETELADYFTMLEAMGKSVRTSATNFKEFIDSGLNIDFGDADHAADNAIKFIKDIGEAAKTARQEIDRGYKVEIEALENAWNSVEVLHSVGKITDAQYNTYKALFDETRETFKRTAEEETAKVDAAMSEAYKKVLEQALSGVKNIPDVLRQDGTLDPFAFAAYFTSVLFPIIDEAKNAGLDLGAVFGEDFAKYFAEGINLETWVSEGWAGKLMQFIKENYTDEPFQEEPIEVPTTVTPVLDENAEHVAHMIKKEIESGADAEDIRDAINDALRMYGQEALDAGLKELGINPEDYSLESVSIEQPTEVVPTIQEQPSTETVEAAQEQVSAIISDLDLESDEPITITSDVDTSGITGPMEDAASTAEESAADIKSSVASLNGLHAGAVDMSALTSAMSSAAASAWASARSIQAAVAAANSGGFGGFMGGNIRTGLTSPMISRPISAFASGGFPNSGSIFMADENGNIEMKGKMGSQPVVANNNQIISGISKGVSVANEELRGDVVSELRAIHNAIRSGAIQINMRPSSSFGRMNARSSSAYNRVTGG